MHKVSGMARLWSLLLLRDRAHQSNDRVGAQVGRCVAIRLFSPGIADTEAQQSGLPMRVPSHRRARLSSGTLKNLDQRLGELQGLAALRFTVERIKDTARMILRDGPRAARAERVDALLVDEADAGGASRSTWAALSLDCILPTVPAKRPDSTVSIRVGRRPGLAKSTSQPDRPSTIYAPDCRRLADRKQTADRMGFETTKGYDRFAFTPRADCTVADVPRVHSSCGAEHLHYTGPFVDDRARPPVEFLWHRLDDRPHIYASLGTLQNGSEAIFKTIAQACDGLGVQLVLSLGVGLDPERLATLPGDPIVVAYAPQLEIIKRATLVITHAGLNTVLESLAAGVPMVALPQANDQPGVASRVAAAGAGLVVTSRKLNVARLRKAVSHVLVDPKFRAAAKALQASIAEVDGLERAADIVENTLGIKAGKATSASNPL